MRISSEGEVHFCMAPARDATTIQRWDDQRPCIVVAGLAPVMPIIPRSQQEKKRTLEWFFSISERSTIRSGVPRLLSEVGMSVPYLGYG